MDPQAIHHRLQQDPSGLVEEQSGLLRALWRTLDVWNWNH